MADRRRYTGTQSLQLFWSLLVLGVFVAGQLLLVGAGYISTPLLFIGCTVVWFFGLVAVGLVDRHHWNQLVSASSFQRRSGPGVADLERIVQGYTVTVSTSMPSLTSQTHTTVSTALDSVDASFTVAITHHTLTDAAGLTTGNDTLDDRYVIEGTEQNVARILSTDVQRALMSLDTPVTCTITGEHVEYEVPFTRLSTSELQTITKATVVVADRVETVASDPEAEQATE